MALVKSIEHQCDYVIVIDNASDPPVSKKWMKAHLRDDIRLNLIRVPDQPPNLYALWNLGFFIARTAASVQRDGAWDVAVFNDDTELPEGWFDYVASQLRSTGPYKNTIEPAVACTDPYGLLTVPLIKLQPDDNIATRMCPWAFIVRGELGLRADESMHWWWGDTDFDWQACAAGGVLLLPGRMAKNTCANSTTVGALAEQAGRDGETFAAKWGRRPW